MINRSLFLYAVLGAAAWAGASSVRAASYNEFVSGDLSINASAPTTLNLELGSNLLTAQSSMTDGDLLRLVVPAGATLNAVTVEFHDGDIRVFAGLQQGPTWTAGTGVDTNLDLLLGWVNFPSILGHTGHAGEDILDDIALAATPPRFSTPLGGGAYTMLFQSESTAVNYALSFQVGAAGALPGDFNNSGSVDAADLGLWENAMLGVGVADGDGDGDTDGSDFLAWQRYQGQASVAAVASTPEPGAAALLAPAALAIARRVRWRHAAHRCDSSG